MRRLGLVLLAAWPAHAAALPFDCLIEPSQIVEVRTSVDGIIESVNVRRGDTVKRGQVLVRLQSDADRVAVESALFRSKMEGQVSAARDRVDFARKKLARVTNLQQQNFVSAQARDEAEIELQLAESELKAAVESRELAKIEHRRLVEQLALRTTTSPFDGIVVDRLLNPGDLSDSGSGRRPVLKIAKIDPMRVDIVLPVALFGQLRAGMSAAVQPQGLDGRFTATVQMVDKVLDPASGTFVARLELPNPKHQVPGGVRCLAEIDGVARPTVTRPSTQ